MSIEEKRPVVSIVSNLLTFGIYYAVVYNMYLSRILTFEQEMKFWATAILILVPVLIVAKIVLYIVFSISNTILTRERDKFLKDEFGRSIELKADRNFCNVFMMGFLVAMVSVVFGLSLLVMFSILIFSLLAAWVASDLSSMYYLRKGV